MSRVHSLIILYATEIKLQKTYLLGWLRLLPNKIQLALECGYQISHKEFILYVAAFFLKVFLIFYSVCSKTIKLLKNTLFTIIIPVIHWYIT